MHNTVPIPICASMASLYRRFPAATIFSLALYLPNQRPSFPSRNSLVGVISGSSARSAGVTLSFFASSLSASVRIPQRSFSGILTNSYLLISTGSRTMPISKIPLSILSLTFGTAHEDILRKMTSSYAPDTYCCETPLSRS